MSNIAKGIAEMNRRMKELQESFRKDGTKLLLEAFADFFQKYPDVVEVRWQQYTPYFNDGDECVFRVGEFIPVNEKYLNELYNASYRESINSYWDVYDNPMYKEPGFAEMRNDLANLRKEIGNEALKLMLGDHLLVRISRVELITNEYDHE